MIGKRVDPRVLAQKLGVDLDRPKPKAANATKAVRNGQVSSERAKVEQFDLDSYPTVKSAVNKNTDDRSKDTHAVMGACCRANLTFAQACWAVYQSDRLAERLSERREDDEADLQRCWLKVVDDRQRETQVDQVDDAAKFEQDVAQEHHRLSVCEEAKRRLAAENSPPAPPFDAGLLEEILARPAEPPFRIEGVLPSQAGMLVVAQRKVGKTSLILNASRCLNSGEDFLGRFPVRPISGQVGVLNYEVSGAQLGRWADAVGIEKDRLLLVNLRGRRNPLGHDDDRARLADLLREHRVESLIVDPFGRAYTGASQNDPGEVGAWLAFLDQWTRCDAGVHDLILTAHAGWGAAERSRGASALEDWADSIVIMTRGEGDNRDSRYLRALGRDVDVDEDQLQFDPQTRLLSLTGSGSRKKSRNNTKAETLVLPVRLFVGMSPGATTTAIINAIHDSRRRGEIECSVQDQDIRNAIEVAVSQGHLRREVGGQGKATRHFPVTPSNPEPHPDCEGGTEG